MTIEIALLALLLNFMNHVSPSMPKTQSPIEFSQDLNLNEETYLTQYFVNIPRNVQLFKPIKLSYPDRIVLENIYNGYKINGQKVNFESISIQSSTKNDHLVYFIVITLISENNEEYNIQTPFNSRLEVLSQGFTLMFDTIANAEIFKEQQGCPKCLFVKSNASIFKDFWSTQGWAPVQANFSRTGLMAMPNHCVLVRISDGRTTSLSFFMIAPIGVMILDTGMAIRN